MTTKAHCITVTITSTSGDVVNQTIELREYASTIEELVAKNFAIADAVMESLGDAMKDLATPLIDAYAAQLAAQLAALGK